MAVQALGDTGLIQSLGLAFMQKNGIKNIWALIPPEKQTLYQCAYEVIKAANDLYKGPHKDEGVTGVALTWWQMGHAHKLLSCIESMAKWMKEGKESYTVYVVQKISDWFAKHEWEHLKAPLSEILLKANEYHDAGIKLKKMQLSEGRK